MTGSSAQDAKKAPPKGAGALAREPQRGVSTSLTARVTEQIRALITALVKGKLDRAEAILDEHISRMRVGYRAAQRRREQGID